MFPKAFSQVTISQAATSPKVRLGPLRRRRLQWRAKRSGKDEQGARAPRLKQDESPLLRLGHTWEVDAWEIAHLGNCTFWKLKLGKMSLGKYQTSDFLIPTRISSQLDFVNLWYFKVWLFVLAEFKVYNIRLKNIEIK